jgi:hypothetical protein
MKTQPWRGVLAVLLTLITSFTVLRAEDGLVLHDATPVRLRLSRNLSSADATVGETVDFEVLDDVKVVDTLIIARGGTAIATVTQAKKKGRMSKGGKLDVNIDFVRAVNGDRIALRAVKEMSGDVGKDVTIPKGTEVTAYSNGEIKLEPAKFAKMEPSTAVTSAAKGPKMTNSDVITLKANGFTDEFVISKIKASTADYGLEVNDLLELKKANISEAVITSMIEASKR